jgi:hypothetical protein
MKQSSEFRAWRGGLQRTIAGTGVNVVYGLSTDSVLAKACKARWATAIVDATRKVVEHSGAGTSVGVAEDGLRGLTVFVKQRRVLDECLVSGLGSLAWVDVVTAWNNASNQYNNRRDPLAPIRRTRLGCRAPRS